MHNACKPCGLQVLQKLSQEFYIKEVGWATHEAQLRRIREQVFILEQGVPVALEWDDYDMDATHLLALDQQLQAIGCARLLPHGSIGRMAVLQDKRGRGVGKALLNTAISICQRKNVEVVTLSAQTQAIAFYEKAGFVVCSEVYVEATIDHVDMQLKM